MEAVAMLRVDIIEDDSTFDRAGMAAFLNDRERIGFHTAKVTIGPFEFNADILALLIT